MDNIIDVSQTEVQGKTVYQRVAPESMQVIALLEPGIYFDLSAKYYHQLPYVSNSYLGKLKHCPATAQEPWTVTAAMTYGRAFHTYILEPNQFKKEFFVVPDVDGRTSIGRKLKANAVLDNLGKEALQAADVEPLIGMGKSVSAHPSARVLLRNCYVEVTLIWDHVMPDGSKIRMKARVDAIPKDAHGILADLKSAKDASEVGFLRSIVQFGYYRQAAVYLDGLNTLFYYYEERGLDFPFPSAFDNFTFIAVEKDGVYRTECYDLTPAFYEFGRGEYHQLLEVERACRQARRGPVYPAFRNAGVQTLDLPQYLRNAA